MNGKKWTNEEIDFLVKNYEEKGVDYVSKKLNRTKNSIVKYTTTVLGLTVQKENIFIDKNTLIQKMKISHSYRDLLLNLNKVVNGQNLKILKKYIDKYNIPKDIFVLKIDRTNRSKKSMDYWLQKGTKIGSSKLKEKLYKEGIKKRKCELCNQGEDWKGKHMSLILDHINGINDDNRLENLRIVCPNCNATLDTHCGKNKKRKEKKEKNKPLGIKNGHLKQRKVERPPYEQLLKEVKELGYCGTGRRYGVSDNSIRKWMKNYEKYIAS